MANSLRKYTQIEASNAGLGQSGSVFIDDDDVHTGDFVAITALIDSQVDVSESTDIETTMVDGADGTTGATTMTTDFTIPKGVTIYGRFPFLSLVAGGKVIAYKG